MNHPQLLYRAECTPCDWVGELKDSKAPAMDEKETHLATEHADDDLVGPAVIVTWHERNNIPKS